MSIILWIILGLIAGWIASMVMKTDYEQGMLQDILLGVVGALVGGFVMNTFGGTGITGFNLYSLIVATGGAIALIALGKALRR